MASLKNLQMNISAIINSALFLIPLIIFVMCGAAPAALESSVKISSAPSGALSASCGDTVIADGIEPVLNLMTGPMTSSAGDLVIDARESATGEDDLGAYYEAAFHYVTKEGKKAATLFVKTRPDDGGICSLSIDFQYDGRMPLRPDVPLRLLIKLPQFARGQGATRFSFFWTHPFFAKSIAGIPTQTQFLLIDGAASGAGALIPLVGGGMKGFFENNKEYGGSYMSFDNSFRPKRFPALALAWGRDPYAAVRRVYQTGMADMGVLRNMRLNKGYPDMFEYFGYDPWNAYYRTIDKEKLINVARTFHDNGFPLRWMTIDDGWEPEKNNRLTGFEANDKFPGGLKDLARILKRDYGLTWIGAFTTFQTYWQGINPESPLAAKYKKYLFKSIDGKLLPDFRSDAGYKVFYDYYEFMRNSGIDFVKVDYQSYMADLVVGQYPIGDAMQQQQRNMQAAVGVNFGYRMINCMHMTIENIYFWQQSNITRCSDDFAPDPPNDPQRHITDNIYNDLWQSQLSWPDFDMWQSHHPRAEYHAALRAISGGPIYVTDTPGMQRWDILWKLVYPDGRILRADEPALPTPDVLFTDTATESVPLKAFTRVGRMGVVGAFNTRTDDGAVSGSVSPADVPGLTGERFAVYEHFSGSLVALGRKDSLPVSLPRQTAALYHFSPVVKGFAPIGITDKMLSGRTVLRVDASDNEYTVDLACDGTFTAWLEHKPTEIFVDSLKLPPDKFSWMNNTLTVKVEANKYPAPVVVRIRI